MYEIKTERMSESILVCRAKGMEDLIIDLNEMENNKEYYSSIYGFVVPLMDCGTKYDLWFSRFLFGKEKGCKLSISRTPVVRSKWFGKNPVRVFHLIKF